MRKISSERKVVVIRRGLVGMMGNLVGLLARCWVAGNPYPPGHLWATVVRRTQPHLVGSGYLLVRGKTVRGKAAVSVLGHLSVAPGPLSAHT